MAGFGFFPGFGTGLLFGTLLGTALTPRYYPYYPYYPPYPRYPFFY
jgi:hypothetical protein